MVMLYCLLSTTVSLEGAACVRVTVVEEEVNSVSVVPVQEKNTSECVDE